MKYKYAKDSPCYGCPYTFEIDTPSCTMGGNPKECIWTAYKNMTATAKPVKDKKMMNTKNVTAQCNAYMQIQNCIEMLINVAERKFGKNYADKLRRDCIENKTRISE